MNRRPQVGGGATRGGPHNQAALQTTKTVFVANIPFDVTEEQLTSIFAEVGPVQEFVLKFDQTTGKAKGFGFCHYMGTYLYPLYVLSLFQILSTVRLLSLADHETALSAVRNLQEVVVNGRNLRVELSPDEPYKPRTAGPPTTGNQVGGGFQPSPQGMGMNGPDMGFGNRPPGAAGFGGGGGGAGGFTPPPASNAFPSRPPAPPMGAGQGQGINLGMLPPGQDVPPGMKATDVISKTLASIPPGKLEEVLTGMKTLVQTSPDQARTVLNAHPQLAYALFQAMLLMNVVDPTVLSRIQPIPPAHPTAPTYRPAPTYAPQPPPSSSIPHSVPGQGPPPSMPPFAPTVRPGSGPVPQPPQGQAYVGSPYQQQHQQQPQQQQQPPAHAPPPINIAAQAPPSGGNAQAIAAALNMVSPDQRQMLMQVFQLTQDQIQALPPDQRAGVVQLRSQFGIN
ncbi:hypothetical protein QFC21_006457 [Naganishia friedmannii]|uniref:Uncharacterized protein n=1 Tax=Naganishia friedmannii TaxID=89922 RepID=A0ACC2V321_9TREE|nr:hypothetical protein QFC21_006457 [Naganishia friedmannii]